MDYLPQRDVLLRTICGILLPVTWLAVFSLLALAVIKFKLRCMFSCYVLRDLSLPFVEKTRSYSKDDRSTTLVSLCIKRYLSNSTDVTERDLFRSSSIESHGLGRKLKKEKPVCSLAVCGYLKSFVHVDSIAMSSGGVESEGVIYFCFFLTLRICCFSLTQIGTKFFSKEASLGLDSGGSRDSMKGTCRLRGNSRA